MDESSGSIQSGDDIINSYHLPRPLPLWLNANCAKHIVKGNFMTLSARPKTVEQGEWVAHQSKLLNEAPYNKLDHAKLTSVLSCRTLSQLVELCPRRA